ncbi:hypothetical protein FCIRC_860 [Fusarium circinatum]|uniref:Uncharacterized protein n=1 Tax=Fusarium circinatum TaxID=48490 RepID=A0A8H5X7L6_FUSCI|nr:hypothetical protein FCIRC_860 [Fusarium circinatum]
MSEDSNMKPCALLLGDAGTMIAATPSLGLRTKIKTEVGMVVPPSADPYFGFHLTVRRDRRQLTSEGEGKGVCFAYDPSLDKPVLADYRITVKFPRGGVSCDYLPVPEAVQAKFPTVQNWQGFTYLVVRLQSPWIVIQGYQQKYYDSTDPKLEQWVQYDKEINDVSLLDVLHQHNFYFVVDMDIGSCRKVMRDDGLPPRFTYGYPKQPTNVEEMEDLVDENQGGAFAPCYAFDSDDAHITAISQSVVQDTLWVHREAEMIAEECFPAYFIAPTGRVPEGTGFYLVVSVPKEWRERHELAWRRLIMSNPLLKVEIHDIFGPEDSEPALWVGKILERSDSFPELDSHLIGDNEVVLRVRAAADPQVRIYNYNDRETANEALAQGA